LLQKAKTSYILKRREYNIPDKAAILYLILMSTRIPAGTTQGITQLATVKRLYPAEQIFRLQKQSIFSSFSNKKKHMPHQASYFREVILVSNYIPFDIEL
jgi:hypothetical protein